MKTQRFLAKFIWSLFALGLLYSACHADEPEARGAVGQSADRLIGEAEKDIFQKTAYPIVRESITVDLLIDKYNFHDSYENMPVLQNIQKKSGIKFHYQAVPQESFQQKKNLLLASGSGLPDMIWGELNRNTDINKYGSQGVFLNFLPYLEKYMPNLSSFLDKNPFYKRLSRNIDGNMYGAATIEGLEQRINPDNWFINKQWLDKLGLAVPQTTEEFYRVLKAFKEQDPNGNGKADEIPLTGIAFNGVLGFSSLFGSFGYPLQVTKNFLVVENAKVLYVPATEAYKKGMQYFAKLYAEGLIDTEYFTQDRNIYFAKGKETPEIIGSFAVWHDANVVGADRAENMYTPLPPLKSGGVSEPNWQVDYDLMGGFDNVVVSASTKYPASILRLIDMLYEADWSWQMLYGAWDINLKKRNGEIEILPPPEGLGIDEFRFKKTVGVWSPFIVSVEEMKKLVPSKDIARKNERLELYRPYLLKQEQFFSSQYNYPLDVLDEISALQTDILDYTQQTAVNWLTGIATAWDTYLQQLERIGLQRFIEIQQEAYDNFKEFSN